MSRLSDRETSLVPKRWIHVFKGWIPHFLFIILIILILIIAAFRIKAGICCHSCCEKFEKVSLVFLLPLDPLFPVYSALSRWGSEGVKESLHGLWDGFIGLTSDLCHISHLASGEDKHVEHRELRVHSLIHSLLHLLYSRAPAVFPHGLTPTFSRHFPSGLAGKLLTLRCCVLTRSPSGLQCVSEPSSCRLSPLLIPPQGVSDTDEALMTHSDLWPLSPLIEPQLISSILWSGEESPLHSDLIRTLPVCGSEEHTEPYEDEDDQRSY